jgi:hypothetical protein
VGAVAEAVATAQVAKTPADARASGKLAAAVVARAMTPRNSGGKKKVTGMTAAIKENGLRQARVMSTTIPPMLES